MIVVVILGVLAAIAIPVFNGYIRRGKAEEARVFLQQIRLKQEMFKQAFGRYMAIPDSYPVEPGYLTTMDFDKVNWFEEGDAAARENWDTLGVKPSSKYVYHVYSIGAGGPTGPKEDEHGAAAMGIPDIANRYWFTVRAHGDLDKDGDFSTFELTSDRGDQIYDVEPTE